MKRIRSATLLATVVGATLSAGMAGCAIEGADDTGSSTSALSQRNNEHYGWWREERAARDAALNAYLAKGGGADWKSYKNAPVSTTGVPVMMLRVLQDIFPEIWGDESFSNIGFAKDTFEPGRAMPLGFGWSNVNYNPALPPLGGATLTCAGCHMGRVEGADGSTHHMIGAPSTTFTGFRGALERSAKDPRWTPTNFYLAILKRAGGLANPAAPTSLAWFYGSETSPVRVGTDYAVLITNKAIFAIAPAIRSSILGRKQLIDATLGAHTYSGENAPDLDGKTPGYLDAIGIGLTAIPTLRNPDGTLNAANIAQLPDAPAMIDMMSVWRQADRTLAQWDGSINSRLHRNLAAELGVAASPYVVNFPNAVNTTRFTNELPAPTYPFDVDEKAAMRGKRLYDEYCASCHVNNNEKIFTDSGADANRANIWTPYTRTSLIGLLRIACSNPAEPACGATDTEIITPSVLDKTKVGYTAPPLDGIWSRAPYLHNGSVPTIAHLLTGNRPTKFYRGDTRYDQAKLGFVYDQAPANFNGVVQEFDTTLAGQANTGHTGAYFNGNIDWTTGHHLEDLTEYLKTL
jgi:hypothetical protein